MNQLGRRQPAASRTRSVRRCDRRRDDTGLGAIVDADLAKEAAACSPCRSSSSFQPGALDAPNQSPQSLLGLFVKVRAAAPSFSGSAERTGMGFTVIPVGSEASVSTQDQHRSGSERKSQ